MTKISDYAAHTGAAVDAASDLLEIVDASEATPVDRNKKISVAELAIAIAASIGSGYLPASYLDTDGTLAANSDAKIASQKAVRTYIAAQIAALIASAPGALDTLDELAAALGDDANFAATITTALAGKIAKGGDTMTGDLSVPAEAYGAGWNGSNEVPTKNDVYDKIEAVVAAVPGAYTDEQARDAVMAMLVGSGLLTETENDGADTDTLTVNAAAASDINTGTDTTKALTSDALAGSNLGIRYLVVPLNGSTALTTSDKGYVRIPPGYTGMNLVSVAGSVGTGAAGSSSSGTPTFTVKNVTDNNQMLSTSLTIDAGEYSSATAAAAAVIDATKDDVVTDDLIEVACTTSGTGVTYATVTLGFQLP